MNYHRKFIITAEDEILTDLGLPANHEAATDIQISGYADLPPSEFRPFNHRDFKLALAQDQACSSEVQNSGAALSPSKD